ncbi:hypothetical protein G5I_00856 [Acromyrmex echinatior]|uniref:Uncharacterized protein n=1 Tax=Acromyrmex echinatior TaxID=103372 RepID=F4W605_ACREC|nr:hypothetical protein G5I_00856 [Acromyrmex echinatior]
MSAKRVREKAVELALEYDEQPLCGVAAVATRELGAIAKAVEKSRNIKEDIVRDLWTVFTKLSAALSSVVTRASDGADGRDDEDRRIEWILERLLPRLQREMGVAPTTVRSQNGPPRREERPLAKRGPASRRLPRVPWARPPLGAPHRRRRKDEKEEGGSKAQRPSTVAGQIPAAATMAAVPSAAAAVEMAIMPGTTTAADETDKMDVGEGEERGTK